MTDTLKMKSNKRHAIKRISSIYSHRKSVMMIGAILLMLVCVLGVNAVTLHGRSKAYRQQEAELQVQIQEQQERAQEIKEYEAYVNTDDYIKKIAEEKLGLVDPNEIIFKPAE